MTTIVTALMYSGKEDPSWEITDQETQQLKEILNQKREVTNEMSALSAGLLGYRGFVIESYDSTLPTKAFFFDGIIDLIDQKNLNFIDQDSTVEAFLLETGSSILTSNEKAFISSEIVKNVRGGAASINKSLKGSFDLLTVPPYDAGKWNIPGVQPRNNCYNYANDKITNTFAQPGRGSGAMAANLTCGEVGSASQRDGQITVISAVDTPKQGHYIALVVAPNFDYHWYRLDSNGMWSHKPGQTAAKNTDNSGKLISDPMNCNRGPYTDFCGFFHCIPLKTTIR